MPKISGVDLISDATEKVVRRAVAFSSVAIFAKAYSVSLGDLKIFDVSFPAALFDTVLLVLIAYHAYSLLINWLGDLAAFRLWYSESSIWSQFSTNMKLDKSFIQGSVPLLLRLYYLEKGQEWPTEFTSLNENGKREYEDFKTNVELYCTRLEHAGTRFSTLSWFARYYVWIQNFVFPMALCIAATYLLLKYGTFTPPGKY